ncbi:MAG: hypothetical protein ACI80V_003086 [Rhodothermales bacterium]|jgi:hypothetical protein
MVSRTTEAEGTSNGILTSDLNGFGYAGNRSNVFATSDSVETSIAVENEAEVHALKPAPLPARTRQKYIELEASPATRKVVVVKAASSTIGLLKLTALET